MADALEANGEFWQEQSDQIFKALTSGGFTTVEEAKQALLLLYVPDMSYSRAAISHVIRRLEDHYGIK